MLWPVGELSMYVPGQSLSKLMHQKSASHDDTKMQENSPQVVPSASSNYVRSLFLEIAIASLICLRMHFDVSQPTLDKGGT